jgi:hypothetical protein
MSDRAVVPLRLQCRPRSDVTALLSEDITFPRWEIVLAASPRFYVTEFFAFLAHVGRTDVRFLNEHAARAHALLKSDTEWTGFPANWGHALSYNQFRAVRLGQPLLFAKAAEVILTCEVALQAHYGGKGDGNAEREIYGRMRIRPAVYNIDKFSLTMAQLRLLPEMERASMLADAGQDDLDLLEEMAEGYCVTRETAQGLRDSIRNRAPNVPIGEVRFKPGQHVLGRKRASTREVVRLESGLPWPRPTP